MNANDSREGAPSMTGDTGGDAVRNQGAAHDSRSPRSCDLGGSPYPTETASPPSTTGDDGPSRPGFDPSVPRDRGQERGQDYVLGIDFGPEPSTSTVFMLGPEPSTAELAELLAETSVQVVWLDEDDPRVSAWRGLREERPTVPGPPVAVMSDAQWARLRDLMVADLGLQHPAPPPLLTLSGPAEDPQLPGFRTARPQQTPAEKRQRKARRKRQTAARRKSRGKR